MAKAKAIALNMALLTAIVQAGDAGTYISAADAATFTSHKPALIFADPSIKDASGNIAVRATAEGIAKVGAAGTTQQTTQATKPMFAIASIILPDVVRRGGGNKEAKSIYPFDDLPAPQFNADGTPVPGSTPSFFVPATEDKPNPAKALASTVSSANRRYAIEDKANPTKVVTVKVKNEAGEVVKNDDGTDKTEQKTVPNMILTRQFVVRNIGPDAEIKDGAAWGHPGVSGAAVVRIK